MCGFVAVLQDAPVDLSACRGVLNALKHRGPDAQGEWVANGVFLGHRRLSIIDLTTGDQPMQSVDGRYIVVFNGEIYNFADLRRELSGYGATFNTHSDTEVILEGYRRWGSDVVHRLHGMFAFVLWDRLRRTVFAARDRLGIKPLCWSMKAGSLVICSTLEPFRQLPQYGADYNLLSLRDLMTFDYVPVPRTIYQNVSKLAPGSWFEWSLGDTEPKIERYWSPPVADKSGMPPDEAELEYLLDTSVKRQMISDVPIGAFLSGGIDSSLLVAMMTRHSSEPVRTFSVAFNEGQLDESSIAEVVAKRFATNHTVLYAEQLGPDELMDLLGKLDEPFCDPALVPTYSLSEMTRRHVKVALSGDGGDEVFGGYPKYLLGQNGHMRLPFGSAFHKILKELPWRPRGMDRIYWRTLSSAERIRFSWARYGDFPVFRKDLRQLLRSTWHEAAQVQNYFEAWEEKARRYGNKFETDVLMRADLETYLSENCLVKTDRASMLASLEVRVPYLDEKIVDRIVPLPSERKLAGGQLKSLLMPIARRLLPREVWDRPKHGFTVPVSLRLAGMWRPAIEAALDWGEKNIDIFNYRYLWRLHNINISEGGVDRELWNPFVFLAWAKARAG